LWDKTIKFEIQFKDIDPWFTKDAKGSALRIYRNDPFEVGFAHPAISGHSRYLKLRRGGPEPLVVTRSAGIATPGFSIAKAATSDFTLSISFWLVGPRFEPPEETAS
jgi:hypothetical protein